MYLVVIGYFLLVATALALIVFPQLRTAILCTLFNSVSALGNRAGQLQRNTSRGISSTGGAATRLLKAVTTFIRQRRILVATTIGILLTPPILALTLNKGAIFEFNDNTRTPDERIAVLLAGERLIPPPALAPEVFTTREVMLVRPEMIWASRNWELLDPEFSQRLLLVFKLMRERYGYELVLLEGYRSPERQNMLAARGSHVTNAGAYRSYHQYGLAADCAFMRDGKLVITEKDPWAMRGYELYGELAEAAGLHWGGRWKMRDYGHIELRRPGVLGKPTTIATR